MFLEKLVELLIGAWERVGPVFIVNAWSNAGVLRLGRYHRTCTPGLHWKIPLAEDVVSVNTCMTTMRLPPQTLTTADGKNAVVAAVVRYRIKDVQPYITDVYDQKDALADVVLGAIANEIAKGEWATLRDAPPESQVATAVRRKVNRYGFEIEAVTFVDFGLVRSFRLVSEHAANLEN